MTEAVNDVVKEDVVENEAPFIVEGDQVFIKEDLIEQKFKVLISTSDFLGMSFIENVIKVANMGGVLEEGSVPYMRFPHRCTMVVTGQHPIPNSNVRVFDYETNKEVFAAFVEPTVATFSMDAEDDVVVDKSTNNGTPWTREQLDSMDWKTEFKEVCKDAGIGGRDREKMTKEYISKYS